MKTLYWMPLIALLFQAVAAEAQPTLEDIRDFARDMCSEPPTTSTDEQTKLTGEADAKLGGFLGRFANIGVAGSGTLKHEATNGVLQKDLANAIKNGNDCRVAVLNTIVNKVGISSQRSQLPQDPSNQPQTLSNKIFNINDLHTPEGIPYNGCPSLGPPGPNCGRPVADTICRERGFNRSVGFVLAPIPQRPTWFGGVNVSAVCGPDLCRIFTQISCMQ